MSSHDYNFGSSPYRTVSRQEERMEQHMASLEQDDADALLCARGQVEALIEQVRIQAKGREKLFADALFYLGCARDELTETKPDTVRSWPVDARDLT